MKFSIYLFVCLIVCGCNTPTQPLVIVNAYSDKISQKNMCWDNLHTDTQKRMNKLQPVSFNEEFIHFNNIPYSCEGYYTAEFYQSDNDSCFFIGYKTRDLFNQKIDAGYSPESQDAIFLIEPTGIRLVDRSEYERIKPTLKPHPYDQSLCKPKPESLD